MQHHSQKQRQRSKHLHAQGDRALEIFVSQAIYIVLALQLQDSIRNWWAGIEEVATGHREIVRDKAATKWVVLQGNYKLGADLFAELSVWVVKGSHLHTQPGRPVGKCTLAT